MRVRKGIALLTASLFSLLLIRFHHDPTSQEVELSTRAAVPVSVPEEAQGPHGTYNDSSQPLTGDPTDTVREAGASPETLTPTGWRITDKGALPTIFMGAAPS